MTNVMAELLDEFQREKDCFAKVLNYQVEEKWMYMEYMWKNLIAKPITQEMRDDRTNKSQLYVLEDIQLL